MASAIKDPVCGMIVHPGRSAQASHAGETFYFCSDYCLRAFVANPGSYAGRLARTSEPFDSSRRIAYFSMEVGIDPAMPTYSGGLGVLAGDTLRAMADLRIPAVAVSLLYTCGYFEQVLDASGNQGEFPVAWDPAAFARPLPETVQVDIEGRAVLVRAWRRDIVGGGGHVVPLYLLDVNLGENDSADRGLTEWLYGGDERYRLAQEIILGIGGVRLLRALGYAGIERFHMNEGHAALLVLELLREQAAASAGLDFEEVRSRCVFTTHTPVPAGHDQFSHDLVGGVLGEPVPSDVIAMLGGTERLNMTHLALNLSTYVNGVAKKHGEVSREMFPGYPIDSITNGVYSPAWTCASFRGLYERHIPGWAADPLSLRNAVRIPTEEIQAAHRVAKLELLEEIRRRSGIALDTEALTIGFARRATAYKRAELVLSDPERLAGIAAEVGAIQLVFAGKAHPRDQGGKDLIRHIFDVARQLSGRVRIVYLAEYDIALARLLTAGVDLWLNTPLRPLEASGTSGMKAAHNGVPSFSVLDGWWIEGHIEGVTGWSIGPRPGEGGGDDAVDLYEKLRAVIAPQFYRDRGRWGEVMRSAIAINASFFNTHRMVQQYAASAYV